MLDLRDVDSEGVGMLCFLIFGIRDDGLSRETWRSMRCLFSCCMLLPSPCLFNFKLKSSHQTCGPYLGYKLHSCLAVLP
jgi:hypothetical protein